MSPALAPARVGAKAPPLPSAKSCRSEKVGIHYHFRVTFRHGDGGNQVIKCGSCAARDRGRKAPDSAMVCDHQSAEEFHSALIRDYLSVHDGGKPPSFAVTLVILAAVFIWFMSGRSRNPSGCVSANPARRRKTNGAIQPTIAPDTAFTNFAPAARYNANRRAAPIMTRIVAGTRISGETYSPSRLKAMSHVLYAEIKRVGETAECDHDFSRQRNMLDSLAIATSATVVTVSAIIDAGIDERRIVIGRPTSAR